MKKLLTKALLFVAVLGFSSVVSMAKDYKDLPQDHWAYKQIQILTDFNVVVGYPDGNYRPEQPVTRAEFASMVVKAFDQEFADIKKPVTFSDVNTTDWFWGVIQRAVMFDLLRGYPDGSFNPYGTVERGHVIATVVNALTTETVSRQKAVDILENSYSDYDQIPEWLLIAAGKAEILDMIVHEPGEAGKIAAQRPANRAELAVFIVKMLEQAKLNPNEKLKAAMSPRIAEGIIVNSELDGYIATIPAGTVLPIMVLNKKITCKHSKIGDDFVSSLPKNIITKEKYLLLVEGDVLNGKLSEIDKGTLFVRNGMVNMTTERITTDRKQNAKLLGDALGGYRPEGFWKTLYLKVIKGHQIIIHEGDILNLKLREPVRIDLTNGMILE